MQKSPIWISRNQVRLSPYHKFYQQQAIKEQLSLSSKYCFNRKPINNQLLTEILDIKIPQPEKSTETYKYLTVRKLQPKINQNQQVNLLIDDESSDFIHITHNSNFSLINQLMKDATTRVHQSTTNSKVFTVDSTQKKFQDDKKIITSRQSFSDLTLAFMRLESHCNKREKMIEQQYNSAKYRERREQEIKLLNFKSGEITKKDFGPELQHLFK